MTPQELQAALEAIIYAADEPATLDQIAGALGVEKMEARTALDFLVAAYQIDERGVEVRKVAGGWKFYTKPQHHEVVRKFIKSLQPPLRLTMPALETLAVIAYKQPATVPEINEIRGVNVGGVIKTLLEKRLITTAGRKEVIGRPILYRTSKQFLIRFGLSDLEELPSLKEFEQLAQAALGSDAGIAPAEPGGVSFAGEETLPEQQTADDGDNDLAELASDSPERPQETSTQEAALDHATSSGEVQQRNQSPAEDPRAESPPAESAPVEGPATEGPQTEDPSGASESAASAAAGGENS